MDDFFEIQIPFSKENPLYLQDLSNYFSRLEKFFHANGIDLEIYEAKVGSFIPKMRQIKESLITIKSFFSNLIPIFEKINNNQQPKEEEIKLVQPLIAINSQVNVSNVFYNNKKYNISSLPPLDIPLDKTLKNILKNKDIVVKKFESQILVFSKIDTIKNNQCSGVIKNLSQDKKKVSFISVDIKEQFNFTDIKAPFKKSYIVDVNVYYNLDNSIASYEVINLIDYEERDLFNVYS